MGSLHNFRRLANTQRGTMGTNHAEPCSDVPIPHLGLPRCSQPVLMPQHTQTTDCRPPRGSRQVRTFSGRRIRALNEPPRHA
jgi:hypothetical protein